MGTYISIVTYMCMYSYSIFAEINFLTESAGIINGNGVDGNVFEFNLEIRVCVYYKMFIIYESCK